MSQEDRDKLLYQKYKEASGGKWWIYRYLKISHIEERKVFDKRALGNRKVLEEELV